MLRRMLMAATLVCGLAAPVLAGEPTFTLRGFEPFGDGPVKGSLRLEAVVSQPARFVDFFVDGRLIDHDSQLPHSTGLDSTRIADGEHLLRVVARFASLTVEKRVSFQVRNRATSPVPAPSPAPSPNPGRYPTVEPTMVVDAVRGNDAGRCHPATPCRSIARAAEVAEAGDVVLVKDGSYSGPVVIRGQGTAERPIVFHAENKGGAIVRGGGIRPAVFAPNDVRGQASGSRYVTIRGLTFKGLSDSTAVRASTGWRVEHVAVLGVLKNGFNIRGNNVTVQDVVVEDAGQHSFVGSGTDIVLRRIRVARVNLGGSAKVGHSGGFKFTMTRRMLVEDFEASQVAGPAIWFDYSNADLTFRRVYVHDARPRPGGYTWEAMGIMVEVSQGPVLVEDSRFERLTGAGIEVAETKGFTIRRNRFDRTSKCVNVRNMHRTDGGVNRYVERLTVEDNVCANWTQEGMGMSGSRWWPDGRAMDDAQVVFRRNTFLPGSDPDLYRWLGQKFQTLDAVRAALDFER